MNCSSSCTHVHITSVSTHMHIHASDAYWNYTKELYFCRQTRKVFLNLGLPIYFNSLTEDTT